MAKRLAVFDVDGTLVDSAATIARCMARAFPECGRRPPSGTAVRAIIGLSLPAAMAEIAPDADAGEIERLVAAYRREFAEKRAPDPLFPGVAEGLDRLEERGLVLAVATGKTRSGLASVLAAHGLAARFAALACGDDGPGKPHPFMLEKLIRDTGIPAGLAVMVGDTTFDIEMARAAGIAGIGVAWGNHAPADLMAAGAKVVVSSFPELVDWISGSGSLSP